MSLYTTTVNRRAFTLIELLVVIAIIAILAAILFPVFAQAKLAAKKTQALSQMKQLSLSVIMYANDADDNFLPASMRAPIGSTANPEIWPRKLDVYVKSPALFIATDASDSKMAKAPCAGEAGTTAAFDWNCRRQQAIGYNDATGVDPSSTAVAGSAAPGTEGFTSSANFSQAEESASIGLFAMTPHSPTNASADKERGYVFNPYNGPNSPDNVYAKGLPLIADSNLTREVFNTRSGVFTGFTGYTNGVLDVRSRSAGLLKPIFARYGADKTGVGQTPIIFADGHAKMYSANQLNSFGTVIWRFR
jgi:prepilin-type N-terminal cleavage/methylation domain-containing protein